MPMIIRCDNCNKEDGIPPDAIYLTTPTGWIELTEQLVGPNKRATLCGWPCVLVYTGNKIAEAGRQADELQQLQDAAPDVEPATPCATLVAAAPAPPAIADKDIPF